VLLYPVDAATGDTSGAIYLSRRQPRRDVGAWLHLGRSSLRLAPGRSALLAVRIAVPGSVRPGDHLGGIVAENATLSRAPSRSVHGSRLRIEVRNLSITAVQVRTPGRASAGVRALAAHAGGLAGGHQQVLLRLRNTGDILLKPALRNVVRDSSGRVVQRFAGGLDTFVPQTQIDYPVAVRGRSLRPGRYVTEVTVDDRHGHVDRERLPFSVSAAQERQVFGANSPLGQGGSGSGYLPWVLAGLMALVALGAVWWGRRRKVLGAEGS